MKSRVGIARSWQLGVVLVILGLAAQVVYAQPPQRFRLDVSAALFSGPNSRGFLGGIFAPTTTSIGRTQLATLFDVSGVVNVTERLSLSAGIPFGLVRRPEVGPETSPVAQLFGEDEFDFGLGDVHAELGYDVVGERQFFPGVRLQVEGGAPTADNLLLGADLWRATGRVSLTKSLHPRFILFANGSVSEFFEKEEKEGVVDQKPVISFGGGAGIGITQTLFMTLQIEEVSGGERTVNDRIIVPFNRDLRAGLGLTRFSKGRPRFSVVVSGGRLQEDPTLILTLRWAVLSF